MRAFVGSKTAIEARQAAIDKARGLPRCECDRAVHPNRGGAPVDCPDDAAHGTPECTHATETHRRPIRHPSRDEYALPIDDVVRAISVREIDTPGHGRVTVDVSEGVELDSTWGREP